MPHRWPWKMYFEHKVVGKLHVNAFGVKLIPFGMTRPSRQWSTFKAAGDPNGKSTRNSCKVLEGSQHIFGSSLYIML